MSLSAFIDALVQSIDSEHKSNNDAITSGNIKNHEEYRHRIGVNNGFLITKNLVLELKKKFYYGEEDPSSDTSMGD